MRIIAGEHGGRRIDAPEGTGTRPMLDRVREALFSTLADLVVDARVLDLFAGSGSLGLEALSRGATHARFVERTGPALAALKKNVEALGLKDRARVIRDDALRPRSWRDAGDDAIRYELAFFDPPYPMLDDPNARAKLLAAIRALFETALVPGAALVFHAPTRGVETLRLGPGFECEVRTYGTSALAYVTRTPTEGTS
jgi:16S rRNA (guanine966-N2)-methyltransferase